MHLYRKCWFDPFEEQFISPFLSDCPSLMLGIAIHGIQLSQAMLERGVCELAHSFFHFKIKNIFFKKTIKAFFKIKQNFLIKLSFSYPPKVWWFEIADVFNIQPFSYFVPHCYVSLSFWSRPGLVSFILITFL